MRVCPEWVYEHPQYVGWFEQPTRVEVVSAAKVLEAGEEIPSPKILTDGLVVTGWCWVCGYRELKRDKIEVEYWENPEADPLETSVVAAMVKDTLTTRRIHDLVLAEAFRKFWAQSEESMAELAKYCGLGKTLRTVRRWMELASLPAEVRQALEEGKISKAQAKHVKDLPEEWKYEVVAALRRGDPIRETLIDCGIVTDDHRLSPHDSACRLLNLLARYMGLWTENPKGFRSAYVVGRDKLELVREGIHFLTYVRDELIKDRARTQK